MVASKDKTRAVALFANYTIGGRHAQIAIQEIETLGSEVDVVSVGRFTLKDFVEEVNKGLDRQKPGASFRLV